MRIIRKQGKKTIWAKRKLQISFIEYKWYKNLPLVFIWLKIKNNELVFHNSIVQVFRHCNAMTYPSDDVINL